MVGGGIASLALAGMKRRELRAGLSASGRSAQVNRAFGAGTTPALRARRR